MINESKRLLEEQELVLGEAPGWTARVLRAFPAFHHPNYRLFFVGQLTSLIGTWMHIVALGWLVLILTNSAFWVAFVQALDLFPILLFSLPAGILADRKEKRLILIAMQTVMMLVAFLFAMLTQANSINLLLIMILTIVSGIAHAVEMPARQSFMFEVVGKKDLASAIALNVGMFNSARVIGPAIAGLLIAFFSIPIAFFLNGLSFLAVLFVLLKMKVTTTLVSTPHAHPLEQLKEGIRFASTHPVISTLLIVVAFNSLIPFSYSSIMPVLAKETFHVGSEGLGLLFSAAGLGALFGAIFVSNRVGSPNVSRIIGIGNLLASTTLIFFSIVASFTIALILLSIIGFSLVLQISLANATIQKASPDHIRGRVMSVYALMFLGLMPFGNILMGSLASLLGPQEAVRILAIISLFGTAFYWLLLKPRLKLAQ